MYDSLSGFHVLELVPSTGASSDVAIVHLHGSGERGSDLEMVTRYGLPAAAREGRAQVSCPVVCPQLEAEGEWDPERIVSFVGSARQRFPSIVLIGYSLGASGVCETVARHGAVARLHIAIAGQAPERASAAQSGVQFLAIQGELDPWPSTSGLVSSINALGGEAQSVTLPAAGHFVSEVAIAHPISMALLKAAGVEIGFRESVDPGDLRQSGA
jgi:predicted esterase